MASKNACILCGAQIYCLVPPEKRRPLVALAAPLVAECERPRLCLLIITSDLETNKIEARSYHIIPCECGKIWQNVAECGKIWQNVAEYSKLWKNCLNEKHENPWFGPT